MNRDETAYFSYLPPGRLTAVLGNVPHAGEEIPAEVQPTIVQPAGVLRRDADLGVDCLSANGPGLGVGLLVTRISRFVVDLNRHPDDMEAAVDGPVAAPPPVSYGRRGLFWMETTRGEVVVDRRLTPAEVQARMRYYHPFHQRLADLLAERRRRFGFVVLLDLHSMPSCGAAGHADTGQPRADFVLGDNLGKACQAILVESVTAVIEAAGFSVARNEPYKGGYNTQHYGRPERRVHALQIEINRALYMDEAATAYQPERAAAVRAALDDVFRVAVALEI